MADSKSTQKSLLDKLRAAVREELHVDSYPDLIADTDRDPGGMVVTGTDGNTYRITVDQIVIDERGRIGVVDGPRCPFCIEHGVAVCRHLGM